MTQGFQILSKTAKSKNVYIVMADERCYLEKFSEEVQTCDVEDNFIIILCQLADKMPKFHMWSVRTES